MLVASAVLLVGCSINKWAVDQVAGILTAEGEGTVFTGDDDPELIGEALPFAMKMYEALLETSPGNAKLLLTTGQMFAMYAFAFVQSPADMLPDTEFDRKKELLVRAKRLYLRGRGYLFDALEIRHPGFRQLLLENRTEEALQATDIEDVPYLYWTAASWLGAFSVDAFDLTFLMELPSPVGMVTRVLELDEGYGAAHELLLTYYGSVPSYLGGSEEKARYHFQRSVELSGQTSAGPYVGLATTVCVANQDIEEFRELLAKALSIDVDQNPQNRLANILSQRKAIWLLDNVDMYFLVTDPDAEDVEGYSD